MKKNDYITTLRSHLTSFSELDRQEILSDIDEHFTNGINNGKTEDEISSALGDPAIIARQYIQTDSDNNTSNQNVNSNTTTINMNNSGRSSTTNIIILIVLNLFLMSWILPTAFSIVFSFWMVGVAIFVSGIVVFFASLVTNPVLGLAGLFAGLGLISLGLLICIGMFYGTKALVKVIKIYVKWNIKFAKGDA